MDIDALARMLSREANRMRDSMVNYPSNQVFPLHKVCRVWRIGSQLRPLMHRMTSAGGRLLGWRASWKMRRQCQRLTPSRLSQGGTTSEEDDEGYVTDPDDRVAPPADASSEPAADADTAARGEDQALTPDKTLTPGSVEEFRQRLARQESGAETGTSSRPAAAFGLEACFPCRSRQHIAAAITQLQVFTPVKGYVLLVKSRAT